MFDDVFCGLIQSATATMLLTPSGKLGLFGLFSLRNRVFSLRNRVAGLHFSRVCGGLFGVDHVHVKQAKDAYADEQTDRDLHERIVEFRKERLESFLFPLA